MATPRIRRRPAHRDNWRASYCEQTSPARTCCRSNLPSVNAGRARRQQSPRCRRSVGRGGGNRTLPNHRNRWIPLLASATRRVPSGPIGSRDVRLLTPSTGAKRPPRDRRRPTNLNCPSGWTQNWGRWGRRTERRGARRLQRSGSVARPPAVVAVGRMSNRHDPAERETST